MHPASARFGVGFGNITTDINKNISLGADGPAYYNARYALNIIKKEEKSKSKHLYNTIVNYSYDENNQHSQSHSFKYIDTLLDFINTNLSAMTFIESKWTNKQRKTIILIKIIIHRVKLAIN